MLNFCQNRLENLASFMSSSFTLKCAKSVSIASAKTNYVYVHANVLAKLPGKDHKYVIINGFIFKVDTVKKVEEDQISLNQSQRILLNAALDQPLTVRPYLQNSDTRFATHVKIEISFYKQSQSHKIHLKAKEIFEHWKQNFSNIPFVCPFEYYIEYDGNAFTFKTVELNAATAKDIADGKDAAEASSALFNSSSTCFKFTRNDKNIQIEDEDGGSGAALFKPNWDFSKMGIGGLDDQFATLFRRAFASRIFPPSIIKQLGIQHVKGILLYGPPGTGKTLMARQIGKMLNTVEPKIVNGPELLNKYVGESEANVRKLFEDAIKDQNENGDDASLHLIIFDEFDSLTKQRGRGSDNTGTEDRIVNQLLSMIDGVDSLNNVLIIGMTNRRDLIDNALLRPGRFEVQIEVNLPDEKGRLQIFNIHTSSLRESKRLSKDVDLKELARESSNYTGAEIAGVVKSAVSFAMNERINIEKINEKLDISNLVVTRQHMMQALMEVRPAFGVEEDTLAKLCQRGMINYSDEFISTRSMMEKYLDALKNDPNQSLMSFCISGLPKCGQTAFAAQICRDANFSFVRAIQALEFIGTSEDKVAGSIHQIFEDAYKSPYSAIIIDNIDRLIEYTPIGPRFSNKVFNAILNLLTNLPPIGRKLAIFVTTSMRDEMRDIGLKDSFFYREVELSPLTTFEQLTAVVDAIAPEKFKPSNDDAKDAEKFLSENPIPIKEAIQDIDLVVYEAKGEPITWAELKFALEQ